MKINLLTKVHLTTVTCTLLSFSATSALAFTINPPRSLGAKELKADQSIFRLKNDWNLSSDLNGTVSFTTPFDFPFPADDRNVTGSRTFIQQGQTSYEQQFSGQYQDAPPLRGWKHTPANLFDDSFGKITPEWGQKPGWKTLTGAKEQFSRTWELTKTVLNPGELGCPTEFDGKEVKNCPVIETWWGGVLDIKAGASLTGSIGNSVPGTELTSITIQLDRVLDYRIDDSKTSRIASILSGVQELKLTDADSGLGNINIKFNAKLNGKTTEIEVAGDTVWRQQGVDVETANPSYQLQVGTDQFLIDGVRGQYTEKLIDFPTMRLGIEISNGTGANASAFMGAFNPFSQREAIIRVKTVPEPTTFFGVGMALGLGTFFKRKQKSFKSQKKK